MFINKMFSNIELKFKGGFRIFRTVYPSLYSGVDDDDNEDDEDIHDHDDHDDDDDHDDHGHDDDDDGYVPHTFD